MVFAMKSNKLKTFLEICKEDGAISGWLCLIVSIILLITSFLLPPMGQIDPSVLQAVAELGFFMVIFKLPNIISSIKDGHSVTIKKGETELTVSATKEETEE